MAETLPFRGILYNPLKVSELADVVTPPYDVISPQEQEAFYRTHPNNMIRLILGKAEANDTPTNNPHTRAARYFNEWMAEGILKRDDTPAYYLTSTEFEWGGKTYCRHGLITRVRIEPFEKGVILPHEKTFSRVKSERLELLKACNTNFDPVFTLYPDNNNLLTQLVQNINGSASDLDFTDQFGQHNRLWRLTHPDIQRLVTESLASESLFIADGHHRYETALNYRNWMMAKGSNIAKDHPVNFVMMYLSSMKDPGLIVLPTHRLLKEMDENMLTTALRRCGDFFDVNTLPFDRASRQTQEQEFLTQLNRRKDQNTIGLLHKSQSKFYILTLKPGVMNQLFADTLPAALRDLDVTVLTRLIFMEMLGFDQARLDNEQLIGYNSRADKAIDSVVSGEYDAAFILNPTQIEQVRSVAQNRLTMPRKSTYFYPKVTAGIVQNILAS